MTITAYRIDRPPQGELETGQVSYPTDDQMKEESQIRQEFLDAVSAQFKPVLEAAGPTRQGKVYRIQLFGTDTSSQMNHYLLLVSSDFCEGESYVHGIDLEALAGPGGQCELIGCYANEPLADQSRIS